jgi:hypothetical protein
MGIGVGTLYWLAREGPKLGKGFLRCLSWKWRKRSNR